MPELRLIPLDEMLSKGQLSTLQRELREMGIDEIPVSGDIEDDLDEAIAEDQLDDFMDRLDARELACDVYLPVEFEGRIELGEHTVGSAFALLEALDELREELSIEEDEDGEDEEEEEGLELDAVEEAMRAAWRTFLRAANACIEKHAPLRIL